MGAKTKNKPLSFGILLGDILVLFVSLWLTLLLRYWQIPKWGFFSEYILPFSLIFAVWLLIFYIADLYGRSFYLYRKNLFGIFLVIQAVNGLIAATFFYFLPLYGITPKVVLFLDLAVSFLLLFGWRSLVRGLLNLTAKEDLVMIGASKEFSELAGELKKNEHYGFNVMAEISSVNLNQGKALGENKILDDLASREKNTIFVVEFFRDLPKETATRLYDLMFRGSEFFDFQNFYERIFQYVPLSFVSDEWLLANISSGRKGFYDLPKRMIDVLAALALGLISLIFYPFIILAIKFNDWGPIFFINNRVGQNNKVFKQIKFRTMQVNAEARWPEAGDKRITWVGSFLRKTRLDELPQLWNVLLGEMSFVGPRPDYLEFVKTLQDKIPYYNIRNLIKPGLTGWAQIQQNAPTSIEETHKRLAYDIYYMKNRSLFLDLTIVLQTIRIMLSRSGV